jgi:geranylgeranyl pyrophosphate synthase
MVSEHWMAEEKAGVDGRLAQAAPAEYTAPAALHRALRYSLLAGGKRLRPLLCRAAARAIAGEDVDAAWTPAMAVEMIHTYSLIHDDLPALDNDALRRGRPTCHVVFGEGLAILAGDALLTLAFEQLAATPVAPAITVAMLRALARAAGTPAGMVAGQVADLEASAPQVSATENLALTLETVRAIHTRKTAALIGASVVLGGLAAQADAAQLQVLEQFGAAIGLAFQIVDDLLDLTGSDLQLGKTAGKDAAQAKATYPAAVGAAAAHAEAQRLQRQARELIAGWGAPAARLQALATLMVERQR